MKLGSRKSTQPCLCTDLCNHPSQRQRGWAHRGCKQPTKLFCCAPREDRTQHGGNMHRTPCPTDICVQYISERPLQWSQGGASQQSRAFSVVSLVSTIAVLKGVHCSDSQAICAYAPGVSPASSQ